MHLKLNNESKGLELYEGNTFVGEVVIKDQKLYIQFTLDLEISGIQKIEKWLQDNKIVIG